MKLTVVIVNYNVKHFLRQCLQSVQKASAKVETEVFVVDNNSVDGSVSMVRKEFPDIKVIANEDNVGFSKANNQAIKQAKGDYILLLNPDTVIQEDTFQKTVQFMDDTSDVGGLGVKMIDGSGKFLPESKRGLPTPIVAFYKISGLSSLFPKSKRFGKYHLKYLDKEKTHQVDVLSGAFMLLRKSVIDEIGNLDETFFMYGEDIDLSYRITKAGYKNYYFPETTIIHYKGESTKKESVNYVIVFYNAMIIFSKKHFTKKYASIFSFLIRMAIMMSAGLAIFKRLLKRLVFPAIDFLAIELGFWLLTPLWENYQFGETWFPDYYLTFIVPIYVLIWLIAMVYSGGYDRPYKILNVLKGVGSGTLLLFIIYALLPESYRFSRVMLILGAIWASIVLPLLRLIYVKLRNEGTLTKTKSTLIVGNEEDIDTLQKIPGAERYTHIVGYVSVSEKQSDNALGNINNIEDVVRVNNISEVIFSAQRLSTRVIIQLMIKLGDPRIRFKIVSPDGISVIGSSTILSFDDIYSVDVNAVNRTGNQRFKRTLDVFVSLFVILLFPVIVFTVKKNRFLFRNSWSVLWGRKSWVGFTKTTRLHELPPIKEGILNPAMLQKQTHISEDIAQRINVVYAKDYRLINDLAIVFRLWKQLGH